MMANNNQSKYLILGALLAFLGLTILIAGAYLAPLVLGAFLAAMSYGWYDKLITKLKGKKNVASAIIISFIILIIVVPALLTASLLAREALNLFLRTQAQAGFADNVATQLLEQAAGRLNFDAEAAFQAYVVPALKDFGLYLSGLITGVLSDALQLFIGFFIMILTTFYLLRDGDELGKFITKISPLEQEDDLQIYKTFKKVGTTVFYGDFVSALAQGALGALGFWLFGIASPVLWGTVMAFLALIPYLGPPLIFIPVSIYLFLIGQTGLSLGFLAYNILLLSSIENLAKPYFIGSGTRIHPFLILISILGALRIFGVMGIIYGPLIIAILFALADIYSKPQKNKEGVA